MILVRPSRRPLRGLLVSLLHRRTGVKSVVRSRMGALSLLGCTRPLLSTVPHPLLLSARTAAGAARRARMRKGRDMEHFVGIDVAKDRLDVHL